MDRPVDQTPQAGHGREPRALFHDHEIERAVVDARVWRDADAVPELGAVRQHNQQRADSRPRVRRDDLVTAARVARDRTRRQHGVSSKTTPAILRRVEPCRDVGVEADARDVDEQAPGDLAGIDRAGRAAKRGGQGRLGMRGDAELARQAVAGSRRNDAQRYIAKGKGRSHLIHRAVAAPRDDETRAAGKRRPREIARVARLLGDKDVRRFAKPLRHAARQLHAISDDARAAASTGDRVDNDGDRQKCYLRASRSVVLSPRSCSSMTSAEILITR